MRLKNLILLATLGVGLVSCSKDNVTEGDSIENEELKSITLKLGNVAPVARGTSGQIDPDAEGKTTVALKNIYVLFADNQGKIQDGKDDDGKAAPRYYATPETEITFHLLPGEVSKVIVIGNVEGKAYYNGETTVTLKTELDKLVSGTGDASVIESLIVETEDEQNAEDLLLYGVSESFTKSTPTGDHKNYYETTVSVSPLISRIEVTGFTFTPTANNEYNGGFVLKQLALNQYYKNGKLGDGQDNQIGDAGEMSYTGNNLEDFFADNTKPAWSFNDLGNAELELVEGETSVTLTAETLINVNNMDCYHYHVLAGNKVPQLLLQLEGIIVNGEGQAQTTENIPLYLGTKKWKSGDIEVKAMERGKIYRMSFAFNDEDVDMPSKCVDVTVDVAEWTVVPVVPEF